MPEEPDEETSPAFGLGVGVVGGSGVFMPSVCARPCTGVGSVLRNTALLDLLSELSEMIHTICVCLHLIEIIVPVVVNFANSHMALAALPL